MKYYQLTKDLPTFEKGEVFFIDGRNNLISMKNEGIVAYSEATLAKFPNILKDWFVEVPAPERDSKTKYAFMEYISNHKEERFFQAVRNFTRQYLRDNITHIEAASLNSSDYGPCEDTFYWECDEMLKEEGDEKDSEEQRADEY